MAQIKTENMPNMSILQKRQYSISQKTAMVTVFRIYRSAIVHKSHDNSLKMKNHATSQKHLICVCCVLQLKTMDGCDIQYVNPL